MGAAVVVTFDLFAEAPVSPVEAGSVLQAGQGRHASSISATTHYRRAMAAARRIRRARRRDLVGHQICEHLRGMLGAEEGPRNPPRA